MRIYVVLLRNDKSLRPKSSSLSLLGTCTALTFAATGIGFTVYGVPLAQDSALIDTGLDFALGPRTTAGVSYSAEIPHNVHDNAVKGRLTWLF
jgi:uncharacterized protein with beta-barrel porin domain